MTHLKGALHTIKKTLEGNADCFDDSLTDGLYRENKQALALIDAILAEVPESAAMTISQMDATRLGMEKMEGVKLPQYRGTIKLARLLATIAGRE